MLFDGLLLKRDDPGEVREGADSRGVAEFLVGRNFEAELDDALDMWKDDRHFRLHQLVKNLQRLASLFLKNVGRTTIYSGCQMTEGEGLRDRDTKGRRGTKNDKN